MEETRQEVLSRAITLAIYDPRFRRGAVSDLEGALRRCGCDLNDGEVEELGKFHSRAANMTDEELVQVLTEGPLIYRRWQ
jgi:hypothetical protein